MSEARTPSFLVRQARRYRRIARRAHYELEGSLATRSRLTEKTFRAGVFLLELKPRRDLAYGWVHLRLDLSVTPVQSQPGESEEVLDVLQLGVSAENGRRLFPLRRLSQTIFEGIAFIPPTLAHLFVTGVALSDGTLEQVDARLIEVARQEAFFRTLMPHLPRAIKQINKLPHRLGKVRTVLRQGGLVGLTATLAAHAVRADEESYVAFQRKYDTLTDVDAKEIFRRIDQMASPPKISILLPTYETDEQMLDEAIGSVCNQFYPHWELCIADDASKSSHVRQKLEKWAAKDSRIKFVVRKENGHISAASNSALELATHEWVALLDHDDVLTRHALYLIAEEIVAHPHVRYIYSDEDKLDAEGRRCQPYFKPDFNYDLLLAQNYVTHFSVYRREDLQAIGGFRSGFDGSQDYDLVLRIIERITPQQIRHIPHILYHWRILEGSAAGSAEAKPYAYLAAERAIQEHLDRKQPGAYVRSTQSLGSFQIAWPLPNPSPKVSIIIPTRDRVDYLKRCVDSILTTTAYRPFEIIIVDNGSVERRTKRFLENIKLRNNVKVVSDPSPFNFSALNNLGSRHASGSVLAFVNNDIEVTQPDWLKELVSHVSRPGIGAVGPRLLFPNGLVQHLGIVLGLGAIAAHPFAGMPAHEAGYFGRSFIAHNVSAVTGACLVVSKAHFDEISGMDETLPQAYNDVDFCLRLGDRGLVHVVTPHVTLFHHESASRLTEHESPRQAGDLDERREGFADEFQIMMQRYGDRFHCDPCYNPNLTLASPDYSLAKKPRHPYIFRQGAVGFGNMAGNATLATSSRSVTQGAKAAQGRAKKRRAGQGIPESRKPISEGSIESR